MPENISFCSEKDYIPNWVVLQWILREKATQLGIFLLSFLLPERASDEEFWTTSDRPTGKTWLDP